MRKVNYTLLFVLFSFLSIGQSAPYLGGVGRGDNSVSTQNHLSESIWIGPTTSVDNLISTSSNWSLGYAPKYGNLKIDNSAVRDIHLVNNLTYDTLMFQENTLVKVVLGDYNFKLKHFLSSTDRQLFKTTGSGSVVIPLLNNGNSLKFPVGNSDYNPITITNRNTSPDSIAIRVADHVLIEAYSGIPISTSNIQRTWFISKNNDNSLGVDMIFEWDSDKQTGNMSGYYLNHFNGSNWEISDFEDFGDPIFNGSIVNLTLNNYLGSFSPFTFGDSPISPLPVELLNFNVVLSNRKVKVNWETASEQNNDFFTIERSLDGYNFEFISQIKGAGTSNELLSYEVIDENPFYGTSYYRLKQTDFNGDVNYSEIRIVSINDETIVLIYPNPSTSLVNISSNEDLNNIKITSTDGKLIWSENVLSELKIELVEGVYYFTYEINEKTFSKKIVIIK